jgi:hypothetical protein
MENNDDEGIELTIENICVIVGAIFLGLSFLASMVASLAK